MSTFQGGFLAGFENPLLLAEECFLVLSVPWKCQFLINIGQFLYQTRPIPAVL